LPKRTLKKQPSTFTPSQKPNAAPSVSNASTSSSHTHLVTTDREEVKSGKKSNGDNRSIDRFRQTSNPSSERKILRKTSRPATVSKKKMVDQPLLMPADSVDDTEASSEAWRPGRDDLNEIFIIDEQDEKSSHVQKREKKRQSNRRIIDESRVMSFNLKARGDHQAHTIDSSKCKTQKFSKHEHLLVLLPSAKHRAILW
jgi:hypothetical protein